MASSLKADIKPVNLRCESLVSPLGIDAAPPRLSWMLESAQRKRGSVDSVRILPAMSAGADTREIGPQNTGPWLSGNRVECEI